MPNNKAKMLAFKSFCVLTLTMATPVDGHAYVDPGTTGMLSQILYVLFYGALGVFIYLLRYVKQYLTTVKEFLAKLFCRRSYR